MKKIAAPSKDVISQMIRQLERGSNPWGKRRLNRFKTVNGKRYQLHATRGWKAA